MARYRCVFDPTSSPTAMSGDAAKSRKGVELAYEFDAPDRTTLESWFRDRNLQPSEIYELTSHTTQSAANFAAQ